MEVSILRFTPSSVNKDTFVEKLNLNLNRHLSAREDISEKAIRVESGMILFDETKSSVKKILREVLIESLAMSLVADSHVQKKLAHSSAVTMIDSYLTRLDLRKIKSRSSDRSTILK